MASMRLTFTLAWFISSSYFLCAQGWRSPSWAAELQPPLATAAATCNTMAERGTNSAGSVALASWGSPYLAFQFTSTSTGDRCKVQLPLKKNTGNPTYKVTVAVYNDSGATNPSTIRGNWSGELDAATTTTAFAWYDFSFSATNLSNSTKYWIVIKGDPAAGNGTDILILQTSEWSGGFIRSSSDGSTWSASSTDGPKYILYK
jgi:hypothetical protein